MGHGVTSAMFQSAFKTDFHLRRGPGSPARDQSGNPPTGVSSAPRTGPEVLPASTIGLRDESVGAIENLSEVAGGFQTTIAGEAVQIAYPFS